MIEGADYATRLKEHYVSKMGGEHSMFDWARPRAESGSKDTTRKATLVDSDDDDGNIGLGGKAQ